MSHHSQLAPPPHDHTFGQDQRRPGESRTFVVIAITGVMMVVEIGAGIVFGSMALLADGLHMASHAAALGINAFAYVYARRHAHDPQFSFGTGKVNTLGGFTGAILLAGFAGLMAYESVVRLVAPVPIQFNQAIAVAVLGLIVNGVSVYILDHAPAPAADAGESHGHDPAPEASHPAGHGHHHHHGHSHGHAQHGHGHPHDHNLASAYLHVLADALTSLLAIVALLCAKYVGWNWFDPLMGIVGAILVGRWSWGLLRSTSLMLLDRRGPPELAEAVRDAITTETDAVTDLHLWAIGPEIYALIVAVRSAAPQPPQVYRDRLPADARLVHVSIEVNPSPTARVNL